MLSLFPSAPFCPDPASSILLDVLFSFSLPNLPRERQIFVECVRSFLAFLIGKVWIELLYRLDLLDTFFVFHTYSRS